MTDVDVEALVKRVEQLEERVDDLEEERDDLQEENAHLQERVVDLERELDKRATVRWDSSDNEEMQVKSTDGSVYPLGRVVASKASRYEVEDDLEELEERLADGDLAGDVAEAQADAGPDVEAETPLEQVAVLPQQVAERELSPNQLRARFIAKDLRTYSQKNAHGDRILKAGRVGRVVRAGMDVDPHPETVRRIMEAFARFGDDEVELTKRGGEKLLRVDGEVADRLERLHAAPHTPVSRAEG